MSSPPSLPPLLVDLVKALAIGALAGAAVGWFVARSYEGVATPRQWLFCVEMGALYALALASTERGVARWLNRSVPLRSRRAVAVHVVVQAAAALVAFAAVTAALRGVAGIDFPFPVLAFIGLLAVAIVSVSHSVSSLTALHLRIQESERAAAEAELRALRAQINPHFLFNSLNSIACFIRSRPAEAEQVTENLAELFRYSLRASTQPAVSLADEVESVELYLAIEQIRFGERLAVSIAVPEPLRRAQVPSLVLQPLVENAVKHGMQQMLEGCRIELVAEQSGERIRLRVSDTGPGFASTDLETVLARGVGLGNVRSRLRHLFGDAGDLRLLPQGVELGFPFLPAQQPAPRVGGRAAAPRALVP